jgi:2,3-bisphosphoglycerate-dependent phosphoglycerate mutase
MKQGTCNLVLLRHGQSVWNRRLRFTGWTEVPLSPQGRDQVVAAGRALKAHGLIFDICFTSWLGRAAESAAIVLETMGLRSTSIETSWRLNERHYGGLQGLGLAGALLKYGPRTVCASQREFAVVPPMIETDDPRFPGNDPRYRTIPAALLPQTESMEHTLARLMPYWEGEIAPAIRQKKRVLIVSHSNTLRALVKFLDDIPAADMPKLQIPTGKPLLYRMDEQAKLLHLPAA